MTQQRCWVYFADEEHIYRNFGLLRQWSLRCRESYTSRWVGGSVPMVRDPEVRNLSKQSTNIPILGACKPAWFVGNGSLSVGQSFCSLDIWPLGHHPLLHARWMQVKPFGLRYAFDSHRKSELGGGRIPLGSRYSTNYIRAVYPTRNDFVTTHAADQQCV